MDPLISALIEVLKHGDFTKVKVAVDSATPSLYTIDWSKKVDINSVVRLHINFQFDTASFHAYCRQNNLMIYVSEAIAYAVAYHFEELAPLVTTKGKDNYIRLYDFLHSHRGGIAARRFGF